MIKDVVVQKRRSRRTPLICCKGATDRDRSTRGSGFDARRVLDYDLRVGLCISEEVWAALDSKRVVGARLVGRSKTLRKQREVDWITTAVRPLDARLSREFIHRHAPSIQAHHTRHGHGSVKSKSERVV